MLSSVLPWEWILERLLDSKEFSLPCLKELISYIPHIEDPRCTKLLQKVVLRYLEEIVFTRRVDPCAITLVRYIVEAQGGSSLRRIHSLKESVENDLILRVETEVVLAAVRDQNGRRNWEAFEDALEEVFTDSAQETCKAQRRKELMSILSVEERRDELCEELLRKYPLEELLKDLLQFIESKRKLLKTKFLDQLAKDVQSGSYIPSSASRSPEERLSTPTHVSKISQGHPQVPEEYLPQDKAALAYSAKTEPSLPKILLGEPIEKSLTMKECLVSMHVSEKLPSSSTSPVYDGGQTARVGVEELRDRNRIAKKTKGISTGVERVSVDEDLTVDMSPSMMDIEKVARELTNQVNDFVDNMDRFAADIHKVAVTSSEQAYVSVNSVVAQDVRRLDPVSFLDKFDTAVKRPAADQLPESAKKFRRFCSDDSPSRETDAYGGMAKGWVSDNKINDSNGQSAREDEQNIEPFSFSVDDPNVRNETSLCRRFHAFLRQSTQEQLFLKPRASTVKVKGVTCGHDKDCALCRKGGVLLSCFRCRLRVHERCLEELEMGKAKDQPHWFCPSCVEQLTLEVLERAKAEADTARQKAAAFVHASSKQSVGLRTSAEIADKVDQMTDSTGAVLETQQNADGKDGEETVSGMKHVAKSSSPDAKEDAQGREMKDLDGRPSLPKSKHGGKRYLLRSRVLSNATKETDSTVMGKEDLPRSKSNITAGVDEREPMPKPSLTLTGTSAGREAATAGVSGEKDNTSSSRELRPPEVRQGNISQTEVDQGDGRNEEDVRSLREGAECSKDDQTADQPSPDGERTPPRRGRYRGRWKIPGVRRRNLPWSELEVAILREGVKKYSGSGWGFQWKNILEFGYGKFDPSRTAVDLKDKWRNLNKFHDRSSSSDVSC